MAKNVLQTRIEKLLFAGKCEDTEDPLEILRSFVLEEPAIMLKHLKKLSTLVVAPMLIPGMASFLGSCTDAYRTANFQIIKDILKICQADELLMLAEFMKSKIFGRGLGAYNQKLIREILEGWSKLDLETSLHQFPHELSCLVKIIHPRFKDPERSRIIKELFGQ